MFPTQPPRPAPPSRRTRRRPARARPGPLARTAAARLALAVGAVLIASPSPLHAQEAREYGVQPGDRVTTSFFSGAGEVQEAIAGERIVDRNGQLFLPFVGPVDVQGLDAADIRQLLERRYADYYNNAVVDVTVELRVNITGAVRRPGSYFLNPSSTIVDAVSEAGGTGLDVAVISQQVPADPSQVRLIRDGEVRILNLQPDEATQEVRTLAIQSGDWIFVPPRGRSRIRDEVTFWGSIVSFAASLAALIILVG